MVGGSNVTIVARATIVQTVAPQHSTHPRTLHAAKPCCSDRCGVGHVPPTGTSIDRGMGNGGRDPTAADVTVDGSTRSERQLLNGKATQEPKKARRGDGAGNGERQRSDRLHVGDKVAR